jgi:hypothetical protein
VAAQTYLNERPILTLSTFVEKADVLPSALWALTWLTKSVWFGESRYVAIGFGTLTYFDYRQERIGKAIFIDSRDDFLQWSRLLTR